MLRNKNYIFLNILLLAFSTLLTLGIAEVYVRIFNPQPINPSIYITDPVYGVKMIPGWQGYIKNPEYGIQHFRLNSLGFRDKERSIRKPPNTYRIMIFGDSFTWGAGVKEKDLFCRRLENSLNRDTGDVQYEVFNWGVSAWGTAQEMLCLKYQGLLYDPDLVILQYYKGNDMEDNIYSSTLKLDKGGNIIHSGYSRQKITSIKKITDYIPFYRFLAQHSHLVNFIRRKLISKVDSIDAKKTGTVLSAEPLEYGLRLTEAILEEFFSVASRNKIKTVLAVIPDKDEILFAFKDLNTDIRQKSIREKDMLDEVCRRNKVPLLDMSDIFKKESVFSVYYKTDYHLTSIGHKVTAESIESFLKANDSL